MKLLSFGKDGGKESTVFGFWFVEIKKLFSIAVLKFVGKSREAYHTHAFNAVSWVLWGKLTEYERVNKLREIEPDPPYRQYVVDGLEDRVKAVYTPRLRPIFTPRDRFHKVDSDGTTIVLTFRGPWVDKWIDHDEHEVDPKVLTHGRKVVE